MKRARVIIGAILLVALTAATCFSEAESVTSVAYIGEVRKLKDTSGRETDYFIRITTDSIAREKIAQAQAGVRGQIEKYMALLEKEDDPANPLTYDTSGKRRTATQRRAYYRNHWRRRQMSDHLTMWLELKIDYGEEYLKNRSAVS